MATSDGPVGQPIGLRVRQLLQSLGDTPAAVASCLRDHGVAGVPCDAKGCAVARFLSAVVTAGGDCQQVRVLRRVVILRTGGGLPWRLVRLPEPVRLFVRGFDAGEYPRLVARACGQAGQRRSADPVASPASLFARPGHRFSIQG